MDRLYYTPPSHFILQDFSRYEIYFDVCKTDQELDKVHNLENSRSDYLENRRKWENLCDINMDHHFAGDLFMMDEYPSEVFDELSPTLLWYQLDPVKVCMDPNAFKYINRTTLIKGKLLLLVYP